MKGILLLVCFIAFRSFAQNDWSLERCIDSALTHNLAVQVSENSLTESELLLKNASSHLLPSLNGGITHGYNWGQTIDPFTNQFATNRVQYNNFHLNSSITLFSGLQNYYGKKIAEIDQQSAQFNLAIEKRNQTMNVISSYLQARLHQEKVDIAEQHLNYTQALKNKLIALLDLERSVPQDSLKLEAQLAKDEYTLLKSENDLKTALLQLQQVIGISPDSSFNLLSDDALLVNLDIHNTHNEVLLETLNLERQRLKLKQVKGDLFPNISLNGSIGSGYSENSKSLDPSGNLVPNSFRNQFSENFYQSVSATMNIPIFNGNKTRTQLKLSELQLDRVALSNEQKQVERNNSLQQIHTDISNSTLLLQQAEASGSAARRSFENSRMKYENGYIDFTDFQEEKYLLLEAESEIVQAKYQLMFAQLILRLFE